MGRIKAFHRHPDYYEDQGGAQNDMAVIELERKVELNEFVQPVALASYDAENEVFGEDAECHISGWGRDDLTDIRSTPNVLQETDVEILSSRDCTTFYRNYKLNIRIDSITN